ncbi:hypothetical protein PCANC_05786 [Puccinia coronata f. sp. avenae]|uniref:Uncharacterized protein n=1 Tax=Puccinia coronata f. sp. avenae TaxID=200324 RepID=A0A2N5TAW6_9BASI|nr:hypothetical protein PCANC_11367 [Puccinia coronata f. sp. avenae]PLW22600.1 hypothetical protein PCASD_12230 [Puccinia coronata f. sp. avenae]PLW53106.1 hypothetical protein PCANC_05786 [Puccinia coronata f. sp. avenae]
MNDIISQPRVGPQVFLKKAYSRGKGSLTRYGAQLIGLIRSDPIGSLFAWKEKEDLQMSQCSSKLTSSNFIIKEKMNRMHKSALDQPWDDLQSKNLDR